MNSLSVILDSVLYALQSVEISVDSFFVAMHYTIVFTPCAITQGVEFSVGGSVCLLLFQLFTCLRHVQEIVKHLEGSSCEKEACRWSANRSILLKARKMLECETLAA